VLYLLGFLLGRGRAPHASVPPRLSFPLRRSGKIEQFLALTLRSRLLLPLPCVNPVIFHTLLNSHTHSNRTLSQNNSLSLSLSLSLCAVARRLPRVPTLQAFSRGGKTLSRSPRPRRARLPHRGEPASPGGARAARCLRRGCGFFIGWPCIPRHLCARTST